MTDHEKSPRLKVARLIDEYELSGVGEELEYRWTRTENRSSLRDLADYFNRQLLRAVLETNDVAPLKGEVENLYRLLTDDDVTSGVRQQARNRIKEHDIDIESLTNDFVSCQSVRTYLKSEREATLPNQSSSPEERIERKRSMIQRLMARLERVTDRSIQELTDAGVLTIGEFDVVVSVRVHCTSCDTQTPVISLLSNRGCDCDG